MFSAAIALFGNGGVGRQKKPPKHPSNDEVEPKSTILVIDDDPMVLETIRTLLVKRGSNVLTSSSVRKGLEMLHYAAREIRIVVLDYSIPKLNGQEPFKYVRQLHPKAKLIGLTAMKPNSVPTEHLEAVDKLLTKPVLADQLIVAVDELLGDRRPGLARIEPGMLLHPTAKPVT
ncbi:MAG: response regulator [Verrucomicrobiia bacterium]